MIEETANVEKQAVTPPTGNLPAQPQKTDTTEPAKPPVSEEYKALQRELGRVQKERDELRIRSKSTDELKELIQGVHSRAEATHARLEDYIAAQNNPSDDGTVTSTHYGEYQVREAERQKQRQYEEQTAKVRTTQDKIKSKLKEVDIDPDGDDWKEVWEDKDLLVATEKLTERLVNKHKQDKDKISGDVQKLVEQKVKEALIAAGVHRVDMGSGAASDWETVRAAFIKNPSNPTIQSQYLRMKAQRGS